MPYAERCFACVTCGEPAWRRAPASADIRCIHCAIERSVQSIHQMRTKSGLFYERWAASMARAAREAGQLVAIGSEIDSIG